MNRIQQILSKAEHDGTARRIAPSDDRTPLQDLRVAGAPAAVIEEPQVAERTFEPPPAPRFEPLPTQRFEPAPTHTFELPSPPRHVAIEPPADVPPVAPAQEAERWSLHNLLAVSSQPHSNVAEQYRSLRGRIAQSENGHALRVIQVTSPGKGDGKTVTALNLALTMAQDYQKRVLVVDADLRQPRIHDLLGLEAGPGLTDVLSGSATLESALVHLPEHHLMVLPAGQFHERPTELLGSGAMRRLVDTLRAQFDRVIVDTGPTQVADPGAIAALADGLIVVVRAGRTTRPSIEHALASLPAAKMLGLVFNESEASATYPLTAHR